MTGIRLPERRRGSFSKKQATLATNPSFWGPFIPNPALHTNRCYTYLVRNAVFQKSPEQDSTEDVEVEIVPLADIPDLIQNGTITHALVVAAFYWYFSKSGFENKP